MLKTRGYAAATAGAQLEPFDFERRDPRAEDVVIEITHAGICHSDIHQVREDLLILDIGGLSRRPRRPPGSGLYPPCRGG